MLSAAPSFERSRRAPRTFDEAHIEQWGEIYIALPLLRERGVLFETFLLAPVEILRALNQLQQAEAVRQQARAAGETLAIQGALEDAGYLCRNGTWIEKLRHHRRPRGTARLPAQFNLTQESR